MRILAVGNMFPPHHLGGYELAWHSWVSHARASGHQVRVLTSTHREPAPDPGFPGDEDVIRALPWYWHDHRFPRLGPRAVLALEREAQRVFDCELAPPPDAVVFWSMGGISLSLVEVVHRRGLPAAFVVLDDWPLYGPKVDRWQRWMDRPLLRPLAERLGNPAAGNLGAFGSWLFISDFMRRRLAEHGLRPQRSSLAHPGIDPERFAPAKPRPWQGRLLCIGRIDERKGQAIAVEALAALGTGALAIDGGGDQRYARDLDRLVRRLGLGERVSFRRSAREAVASAYEDADAVLFPVQWDEPWGLVPLEAMAVGRPVIASGRGGSAEYLRDGENALIYSPAADAEAIAAAVRRLAGDPALRERLIAGGRETAARFTEAAFNAQVTTEIEGLGE